MGFLTLFLFNISYFIYYSRNYKHKTYFIIIFYLLVLVFLGGVIILIIHISTLAINRKIFYVSIFTLTLNFIFYKNFTLKISLSNFMSIRLYNSMNFILYLLLTLICV